MNHKKLFFWTAVFAVIALVGVGGTRPFVQELAAEAWSSRKK